MLPAQDTFQGGLAAGSVQGMLPLGSLHRLPATVRDVSILKQVALQMQHLLLATSRSRGGKIKEEVRCIVGPGPTE